MVVRSACTLSTEEQEELLHQACSKNVFVARTLLQNGCSVNILSREEQEELLLHACSEGDVFVARTLLKNDCSLSVLFVRDQEQLLHYACFERDVFVANVLIKNGCSIGTQFGAVNVRLLYQACHEGDAFVIEALLTSGCDVKFADSNSHRPLMAATEEDHGRQTAVSGNTALHLTASHNRIQCGILLAEGGASVRTKNSSSKTPLDLASVGFEKPSRRLSPSPIERHSVSLAMQRVVRAP